MHKYFMSFEICSFQQHVSVSIIFSEYSLIISILRHCKLKSCLSKVCHKTLSFHFKSVSVKDETNEIFRFPKTNFKWASDDSDFFEIIDKENDFVVMQKKPLKHDMKMTLTIKHGRFEHTKKINIFVS